MKNTAFDIKFTNYDTLNSVMHIGYDRHYIIRNDKRSIIEEKIALFTDAEKEDFCRAIISVHGEMSEDRKGIQNYQFKATILSHNIMDVIVRPFVFLFNRFVLPLVFIISFFLCVYYLLYSQPAFVQNYFNADSNWFLLIFMCLFHEIGHASACKYYKVPIGDVGFGIAGFRPVMFANVSGAWYLNQKQRIIVNIGGVYFQTIFAAILTVLSLQTYSTSLYYVSKTIMISVLLQFYPFYRMDGYWLISDLMGEPNLYSDSINLFQNKIKAKELKLTKRQKNLLLYFILTEFVVIASLLLFLISNWSIIICMPEKLWISFVSLLDGNVNNLKILNFHFIWVGIILFLLIKSILNIKYK